MQIPTKPYFVGFSTVNRNNPPFSLTNVELVKQDLLQHFKTRKGERVMLPDWGTRIYEYLDDPQDDITRQKIIDDVNQVVSGEPRVELLNMDVSYDEHSVSIMLFLNFVPQNVTDSLFLTMSRYDAGSY
jgi:phage baseplate assembly protein W